MSKDVRPIDHDTGSAVATTAGGAVWGGFKWGALASLALVVGLVALGAWGLPLGVNALLGHLLGQQMIPLAATFTSIIGGALGLGFSSAVVGIAAVPGTLLGALFGGAKASNQVAQEKARAQEIQSAVIVEQARANAGYVADPRFNEASPKISASSAENLGTVEQLQRARA